MNREKSCEIASPESQEFIDRLKNGNQFAWYHFVKRYTPYIQSLLFLHGFKNDLADEAMQRIFINIFKSIHRFKGNSSLSTWIFSVVKNQVAMLRREKKAIKRKNEILIRDQTTPESHTPEKVEVPEYEEQDLNLRRRDIIFEALDDIPPGSAEIARLIMKGLTNKEIAESEGMNLNTVGKKLSDAKLHIKRWILINIPPDYIEELTS